MKDLNISAEKVIRHYDAKRKYCPRKMLDNPTLWVDFKDKVKNGEGVNKMIKHTIVYEGEVDKVLAQIISWNYKENECRVCDIKDYVSGQTQNLYVVGGGACNKKFYYQRKLYYDKG